MNVKFRLQAINALLQRYRSVFAYFWAQRDTLAHKPLRADEAAFLPSALAIQAAPVSPTGRLVAKLLMALVLVLLAWSVLGKIDIVSNGRGKIIPSGYTKSVASVEVARVTGLYVTEGQKVKKGDVLIELDTRMSESARMKADDDRQLALLQIMRSKALLQAVASGMPPHLQRVAGMNDLYWNRENNHLQGLWQNYLAKKQELRAQAERYEGQLPLEKQRADDYALLAKNHDVSEHDWMEKQQAWLDMQGQLEDINTQMRVLEADTRKTAEDDMAEATRNWSDSGQDEKSAAAHMDLLRLVAPVNGTVQQLAIHTVGGAVTAAQPLMLIVPDNSPVEFEAYVEDKDIGFIHEGQRAEVKIDTFEYTKYGTVDAVVTHVSHDAIEPSGKDNAEESGKELAQGDQKPANTSGPLYSVRIALKATAMNIDGREVKLMPGMSGSVEILTGERRIIDYLLSPILTYAHESLRER